MSSSFDRSMLDRFFQIYFGTTPENPQAGLKLYFINNTSALVNWAFCVSREGLECQIRVGKLLTNLNLADNPYIDFITSNLLWEFCIH